MSDKSAVTTAKSLHMGEPCFALRIAINVRNGIVYEEVKYKNHLQEINSYTIKTTHNQTKTSP